MKIAILDDCSADIRFLETLIWESNVDNAIIFDDCCLAKAEFYEFADGETLLAEFNAFDIIFLDIHLGTGMDGLQTAERIRERDTEVMLVFYSASDLPGSRIARYQPDGYLVKHSVVKELKSAVSRIMNKAMKKKADPKVVVSYDARLYVLQASEILFISIFEKGSGIWLTKEGASKILRIQKNLIMQSEPDIKSNIKLEEYYRQLKDDGFIYGKKSYIINARYVIAARPDSVLLSGGLELSVARSRKKEFDSALGEYWGVKYYRGGRKTGDDRTSGI